MEDKADGLHITKTIGTADYQTLKSAGDQTQSLQLSTSLNVVIGSEQNVITAINVVEDHKSADGMKDPANTDATQGADGLSVWSTAKTTGALTLQKVANAPTHIEDINVTAYEALRGIPAPAAEEILVYALWDETLEPWLRDIIAELLIDRDFDDETALSEDALYLLDAYLDENLDEWNDDYDLGDPAEPLNAQVSASGVREINGAFSRSWGKNFGNAYVGVRLLGSLYAATPPESNAFGGGLYVRASQRVDAYVWQVLPI